MWAATKTIALASRRSRKRRRTGEGDTLRVQQQQPSSFPSSAICISLTFIWESGKGGRGAKVFWFLYFLFLGGFCFTLASLSLHSKLNLNPKSNNGAPCSLLFPATALAAAAPCGPLSLPSLYLHSPLAPHPSHSVFLIVVGRRVVSFAFCCPLSWPHTALSYTPPSLPFSLLPPLSLALHYFPAQSLSFSLHFVFPLCLSPVLFAATKLLCLCSSRVRLLLWSSSFPLFLHSLPLSLAPLSPACLKLTSLDFRLLFRSLLLCFSISSFHHWLVSLQALSLSTSLMLFPPLSICLSLPLPHSLPFSLCSVASF